ncbi:hypothetical protein [Pseudoalteromonas sp. SR43-5]|uniref:hypothetical protein n=1 Tax=Pseudoalteromonas sp. SR43-5 TaxID=2760941 RepID=UPI0015F78EF1|nr:hypothetical protein [Pseudoalteromonas sp. SR43-5]MBB1307301.1 hypothetical protein [Pseudoalteromonas sp. SR43-5]
MAAYTANQVSVANGQRSVLINSNESTEHVNRGDFLVIAAHNFIEEIESFRVDESGQYFIELLREWEGANINTAQAIVIPTTAQFKNAVTALQNANTVINDNMAAMQNWQTQTGQVSFNNLNGTQTTVKTLKQIELDTTALAEQLGGAQIIRAILIAQGLSGDYGFFANGFEYINEGDAGVNVDGKIYTYIGAGAPAKVVAANTNPTGNSDYKQITFNDALSYVSTFSELKKLKHLKVGQAIKTLGYHGLADGGHGEYIIDDGPSDELGNPQIANGLTARLQAVNGEVNLLQYGAKGDSVSEDNDSIFSMFTHSKPEHTLVFNSGKTFLVGGVIRIDNNSDKSGITRSYRVKAHGSKILKKDFTGSAFLSVSHNPNNEWYINRYDLDEWDFTWEGGEQDANGFNQNFRMAANLRDGAGTLDTNYYTTAAQQAKALVYQALQAEVFGNPELKWYINPLSSSTPHQGQDGNWLDVIGARTATFKDITTKRRHEEGFNGRSCRNLVFENCHDFDSLPTNDQFQIYITGGGNFTNGQQHFHMRSTNAQTLVRLVVSDASSLTVGQTVKDTGDEDADEHTQGVIHRIQGNQLFLKYVYFGDGFATGTELQADGVVVSGVYILSYNIIEAPTMTVSQCSSNVGNSGIGFMNTENCPTLSSLSVSDYVGRDLGLIGIRAEHVHTFQLTNITIASANILSDPTGTLDYWTMAGIEVGASTRQFITSNVVLINTSITGNNYARQDSQIAAGIQVKFTQGRGRINARTLVPSSTTGVQALLGNVSAVKVSSYKYTNFADYYPINPAIKVHKGRVSDFEINGCQRGIIQCEQISDGTIENCAGRAIDEIWTEGGNVSPVISNVTAKNIESFATIPGGDYATGNDSLLKVSNCTIENVQGLVFVGTHEDAILELRGNSFRNWGLDTTKPDRERWLIGNTQAGDAQTRELYLMNNSFRADAPTAVKKLWAMNATNQTLVEKGSIYANTLPEDWQTVRGNNGVYLRDNYVTDVIKTKDGLEIFNTAGKTVGVCRFNAFRAAYRFNEPSASNFPLYNDDGTQYLSCVAGDVISMVCRLTPSPTSQNQVLVSAATSGVYITEVNTLGVYGEKFTVTINGTDYQDGDDISALLDTKEHTVIITIIDAVDIRYIGSASSGTSEHTTFGIYNIAYTSNVNDDRFYPFDEGAGSLIKDTLSGHDVTLNYGSAGQWYSAWMD